VPPTKRATEALPNPKGRGKDDDVVDAEFNEK